MYFCIGEEITENYLSPTFNSGSSFNQNFKMGGGGNLNHPPCIFFYTSLKELV